MNSTGSSLLEEERKDLRTLYSEGRADLRSFRDTYYQITGIISAAAVGLAVAGIQYKEPVLLLVVPPLLLVVLIGSFGYLSWRADLIHTCANIEKTLGVTKFEDCAYLVFVDERLGKSRLPPFLKQKGMKTLLAVSILVVLIAEYLLFISLFN